MSAPLILFQYSLRQSSRDTSPEGTVIDIDMSHDDASHDVMSHDDVSHNDSSHDDTSNDDMSHDDTSHDDTSHDDTLHDDTSHDVLHDDTSHDDTSHNDTSHDDALHDDPSHDDASQDGGSRNDVTRDDKAGSSESSYASPHGSVASWVTSGKMVVTKKVVRRTLDLVDTPASPKVSSTKSSFIKEMESEDDSPNEAIYAKLMGRRTDKTSSKLELNQDTFVPSNSTTDVDSDDMTSVSESEASTISLETTQDMVIAAEPAKFTRPYGYCSKSPSSDIPVVWETDRENDDSVRKRASTFHRKLSAISTPKAVAQPVDKIQKSEEEAASVEKDSPRKLPEPDNLDKPAMSQLSSSSLSLSDWLGGARNSADESVRLSSLPDKSTPGIRRSVSLTDRDNKDKVRVLQRRNTTALYDQKPRPTSSEWSGRRRSIEPPESATSYSSKSSHASGRYYDDDDYSSDDTYIRQRRYRRYQDDISESDYTYTDGVYSDMYSTARRYYDSDHSSYTSSDHSRRGQRPKFTLYSDTGSDSDTRSWVSGRRRSYRRKSPHRVGSRIIGDSDSVDDSEGSNVYASLRKTRQDSARSSKKEPDQSDSPGYRELHYRDSRYSDETLTESDWEPRKHRYRDYDTSYSDTETDTMSASSYTDLRESSPRPGNKRRGFKSTDDHPGSRDPEGMDDSEQGTSPRSSPEVRVGSNDKLTSGQRDKDTISGEAPRKRLSSSFRSLVGLDSDDVTTDNDSIFSDPKKPVVNKSPKESLRRVGPLSDTRHTKSSSHATSDSDSDYQMPVRKAKVKLSPEPSRPAGSSAGHRRSSTETDPGVDYDLADNRGLKRPSSGGDPRGTSSGGDPRGTSSGGDPRGTSSGGDPRGTSSGGDPRGTSSGGDPRGTSSGGDPRGTSSGGDTRGTQLAMLSETSEAESVNDIMEESPQRTGSPNSPVPQRRGTLSSPVPQRRGTQSSPVPQRRGTPSSLTPQQKGTPSSPVPQWKGTPSSPVPQQKETPSSPVPQQKGTPSSPVPQQKETPSSPVPQQKETPSSPVPQRKRTPSSPVPQRKRTPSSPVPQRKGIPSSPVPQQKETPSSPAPQRKGTPSSPAPQRKGTSSSPVPQRKGTPSSPAPQRKGTSRSPAPQRKGKKGRDVGRLSQKTLEVFGESTDDSDTTVTRNKGNRQSETESESDAVRRSESKVNPNRSFRLNANQTDDASNNDAKASTKVNNVKPSGIKPLARSESAKVTSVKPSGIKPLTRIESAKVTSVKPNDMKPLARSESAKVTSVKPSGIKPLTRSESAKVTSVKPSGIKPLTRSDSAKVTSVKPSGIKPLTRSESAKVTSVKPSGIKPLTRSESAKVTSVKPSGIKPSTRNESAKVSSVKPSGIKPFTRSELAKVTSVKPSGIEPLTRSESAKVTSVKPTGIKPSTQSESANVTSVKQGHSKPLTRKKSYNEKKSGHKVEMDKKASTMEHSDSDICERTVLFKSGSDTDMSISDTDTKSKKTATKNVRRECQVELSPAGSDSETTADLFARDSVPRRRKQAGSPRNDTLTQNSSADESKKQAFGDESSLPSESSDAGSVRMKEPPDISQAQWARETNDNEPSLYPSVKQSEDSGRTKPVPGDSYKTSAESNQTEPVIVEPVTVEPMAAEVNKDTNEKVNKSDLHATARSTQKVMIEYKPDVQNSLFPPDPGWERPKYFDHLFAKEMQEIDDLYNSILSMPEVQPENYPRAPGNTPSRLSSEFPHENSVYSGELLPRFKMVTPPDQPLGVTPVTPWTGHSGGEQPSKLTQMMPVMEAMRTAGIFDLTGVDTPHGTSDDDTDTCGMSPLYQTLLNTGHRPVGPQVSPRPLSSRLQLIHNYAAPPGCQTGYSETGYSGTGYSGTGYSGAGYVPSEQAHATHDGETPTRPGLARQYNYLYSPRVDIRSTGQGAQLPQRDDVRRPATGQGAHLPQHDDIRRPATGQGALSPHRDEVRRPVRWQGVLSPHHDVRQPATGQGALVPQCDDVRWPVTGQGALLPQCDDVRRPATGQGALLPQRDDVRHPVTGQGAWLSQRDDVRRPFTEQNALLPQRDATFDICMLPEEGGVSVGLGGDLPNLACVGVPRASALQITVKPDSTAVLQESLYLNPCVVPSPSVNESSLFDAVSDVSHTSSSYLNSISSESLGLDLSFDDDTDSVTRSHIGDIASLVSPATMRQAGCSAYWDPYDTSRLRDYEQLNTFNGCLGDDPSANRIVALEHSTPVSPVSDNKQTSSNQMSSKQMPFNQKSYNQMSSNQTSSNIMSYNQTSPNQMPFNQKLYKQMPYNQTSFNQKSYNQTPFNQKSSNLTSYNQTTFNQTSSNLTSYNQTSYKQMPYNQTSYKQTSSKQTPSSEMSSKRGGVVCVTSDVVAQTRPAAVSGCSVERSPMTASTRVSLLGSLGDRSTEAGVSTSNDKVTGRSRQTLDVCPMPPVDYATDSDTDVSSVSTTSQNGWRKIISPPVGGSTFNDAPTAIGASPFATPPGTYAVVRSIIANFNSNKPLSHNSDQATWITDNTACCRNYVSVHQVASSWDDCFAAWRHQLG